MSMADAPCIIDHGDGTYTLEFPEGTPTDAALSAHRRGWAPVPIRHGEKRPEDNDWRSLRYEHPGQIMRAFAGKNVGIILGAASGNLVDVDLDSDHARALASVLLPKTPLKHGRTSAPASHWWYKASHETATAQFKDPTDRETLVELRGTGGQTVVPPSVHPSGETLEWSDQQASPSLVNKAKLVKHVRVLAAGALLAKHWPASGGRHDASMALAGGLLRAGWSPDNTASFVVAVGWAVDPEVDRKDRIDAVKSTVKRLEKDEKARGWPALAEDIGAVVVEKVREWLDLEVDEDETGDELYRSPLGAMLEDGIPPPAWILPDTLYAEKIHWLAGEPGDGKTYLMLAFALELMRDGHRVMWVDEESGEAQTAFRLGTLGATRETLDEGFYYYAHPGISIRPQDLDKMFRVVSDVKPALVVFDSAADMLDVSELDEDVNREVTRWIKAVLDPLKHTYGAASVVIDHVVKSRDSRGGWARGAGAKKSKSDVLLVTSKDRDFNKDTVGSVSFAIRKDRDGHLGKTFAYRIGGRGDGTTLVERAELQQTTGQGHDDVEQRIVDFLRLNAEGNENAMSLRQIRDNVTGKGEQISSSLQALADRVDSGVSSQKRGRGTYYWYDASVILDFGLAD